MECHSLKCSVCRNISANLSRVHASLQNECDRVLNFSEWLFCGMSHVSHPFSAVCARHFCRCACHCPSQLLLVSLQAMSRCFHIALLHLPALNICKCTQRLRQNANFVLCLSSAMTLPIVVFKVQSGCQNAASCHVRAQQVIVGCTRDVLRVSHEPCSFQYTHLDIGQSKTPTNAWEMSEDVFVCNFWPGPDLHDIV